MKNILRRLGEDREIRALIINQAVPGTNAAVDRFKEMRDDVFIVYCQPQENPADVARRADLIFNLDQIANGPKVIQAAHEMGAKTFVHYSFPRHMSQVLLGGRRDAMRTEAARLGVNFVDATAPDPTGDGGLPATQQFILEDIPRMITRHGKDTAFYATNCGMQIPLLRRVFEGGGVYALPCCPSPYHAFPAALGLQTPPGDARFAGLPDINFVIQETRKVAAENNMLGRLGNWPVPFAITQTHAGTEYAIKVLNGEVPRTPINDQVLAQVISTYIKESTGMNIRSSLRNYQEPGITLPNYKLFLVDIFKY
jgi:hypothetical protein